jgi:diacylglycerol kinase (ATP)
MSIAIRLLKLTEWKPRDGLSRFTFILNPSAGKGAGRKLQTRIYDALRIRTSDFELLETSRPGDATELARSSSSPTVVAIGGDGTIHEVANGIIGTEKVLGVIPIGSGNDFIKAIGVPKDLQQSISILFLQKVARIDVGSVRVRRADEGDNREQAPASILVNGLGIGFDAAVAERTLRISYASGSLLYLIAVLQTLGRYTSPEYSSSIDGRTTKSRNLLIAVGNGTCAGGGFYLTPEAKVDDGLLDLCFIDDMSILGILKLMPSVMKGKHRSNPSVRFERGSEFKIAASRPISVHSDGEIIGTDITAVEIRVVPRALQVIVG